MFTGFLEVRVLNQQRPRSNNAPVVSWFTGSLVEQGNLFSSTSVCVFAKFDCLYILCCNTINAAE